MKSGNKILLSSVMAIVIMMIAIMTSTTEAEAKAKAKAKAKAEAEAGAEAETVAVEVSDYLSSLNVGAAVVLDADITLDTEELNKVVEEVTNEPLKDAGEDSEESKLVMANVKESMNIRAEADENADKVGLLYKDCGGEVLEQQGGWTKLKSGELIGWAKDEYLLFGDDAETLAGEVGNLVAKVDTETLRVRKEASESADVYGLLAVNDEVIALADMGDWVSVDFDGNTGYVNKHYVKVDFKIDSGETMGVIEARAKQIAKAKAEQEKTKLTENRGVVAVDLSETALLAALIQCEAGGESYEGQLAVGAVVMNRLRSGAYPSTMQGVIYASGQFTPALNGKVNNVAAKGPKQSCIQAAQDALNGISNVGAATHFKRSGSHDGYMIGNHVFW